MSDQANEKSGPNNAASEAVPPSVPPAVPPFVPPARRRADMLWLGSLPRPVMAAVLALAVVLGLIWRQGDELDRTQREFARRIAESDGRASGAVQTANEMSNRLVDLQRSALMLEARLAESQSQQAALEQLYQDLSRNRDEAQLAEIEQGLVTAGQQLQLAGNVQAAIIALQSADTRLARLDKPQFAGLRRAITRDLDRLRSLPSTDITGLTLRLDQVIAQVDVLPTLVDNVLPSAEVRTSDQPAAEGHASDGKVKPGDKSVVAKPRAGPPNVDLAQSVTQSISQWWSQSMARMSQEFRGLVRIREVGTPDVVLLSPQQAWFLRENLKLRLLNARLQLLARNESAFRSDLQVAADLTNKYFDGKSRNVIAAQAQLKNLLVSQVSVELPTLAESLNAVRNFRPGGGTLGARPPAANAPQKPAASTPAKP
jgi:uroporphyrin-3 C-methyltransferase/uroporphyrinogen III methyltransferase/synthase